MPERATIQDIADALGLSRNTVSKAINNTGILADATKEKVLRKAVEMGYKQFSYAATLEDITNQNNASDSQSNNKEIALLTTKFLGDSHFSSTMLDKFQREISQMGYSLSMHRILGNELKSQKLPELQESSVMNFSITPTVRWSAIWIFLFSLLIHQSQVLLPP